MAEDDKKAQKKAKRPTALKRDMQNEKRCGRNRAFKSRVLTSTRKLESALKAKDKSQIDLGLAALYSMLDKGLKKGLYKQNKVNRVKASFTKRSAI